MQSLIKAHIKMEKLMSIWGIFFTIHEPYIVASL